MNILHLHNQAVQASKKAAKDFLENWNKKTGGNKDGEPIYCGLAGVIIYDIRSNSKVGKELQKIGFTKHYPKGLYLNNPSDHNGQSIDVKEEASSAYAKVFFENGFKAYMTSTPL